MYNPKFLIKGSATNPPNLIPKLWAKASFPMFTARGFKDELVPQIAIWHAKEKLWN